MTDERDQEHYESARTIEGRCPRCGGDRITYGGTESSEPFLEIGVRCFDCGYWHDGDIVLEWRPFVMPGASESRDALHDYDGWIDIEAKADPS